MVARQVWTVSLRYFFKDSDGTFLMSLIATLSSFLVSSVLRSAFVNSSSSSLGKSLTEIVTA